MFDFRDLKKTIAAIGGKVRTAQHELETLRRRREEVAAAPTSKASAIRAMQDRVDAQAEAHKRVLFANLDPLILKGDAARVDAPFLAATRHGTAATAQSIEAGICLAFGDQMKQAIAKAIEAMPWPEQSMDTATKAAELAKLDDGIEQAENELSSLVGEAQSAGISL